MLVLQLNISLDIVVLIPQSLQLHVQVTLDSLVSHMTGKCAKSCARRSLCFLHS